MSIPSKPAKAKLFMSIIYGKNIQIDDIVARMISLYGPLEYRSDELKFDKTEYYKKEMGRDLSRI